MELGQLITLILLMYGWRVRRKGWWYRFPFITIPPKRWLLWRFETAWGIDSTYPKWEDFPPIKVMISDIYKFGHFLKNVGR